MQTHWWRESEVCGVKTARDRNAKEEPTKHGKDCRGPGKKRLSQECVGSRRILVGARGWGERWRCSSFSAPLLNTRRVPFVIWKGLRAEAMALAPSSSMSLSARTARDAISKHRGGSTIVVRRLTLKLLQGERGVRGAQSRFTTSSALLNTHFPPWFSCGLRVAAMALAPSPSILFPSGTIKARHQPAKVCGLVTNPSGTPGGRGALLRFSSSSAP